MVQTSTSINPGFVLQDITLRDDAFHKTGDRFCGEWWYFDATFDNGYSVNVNVGVFSKGNYGMIFPVLNIYKDTKRIFCRRGLSFFRKSSASENVPLVKLSGKDIIKGCIDKDTGKWVYNVLLELSGQKVDLHFTGIMRGWKGGVPGSQWGVILPRATVNGTITLNGETIKVNGMGYHDHNWDVDFSIRRVRGWYWGKVGGDLLNLVWSKIMLPDHKELMLAVLNEGKSNYINIKPEKIRFFATNYTHDYGKKIPESFTLQVDDNSIHIAVRMETISVVRQVRMFILNYWRYHVHITGSISYGTYKEKIDNIEILELAKFY